jgi:pilus assembly protein CpaE
VLVTEDQAAANTVQSVLAASGQMSLAGICKDVPALKSYLANKKVQAIVVDIDPDPSRVLRELSTVLAAYPEAYVVVVCSKSTKELVLQAMQAGARHFLEKKTLASDLVKELQLFIGDVQKKGAALGSLVVSTFSAGGGCGATTVAVNLASELRLASSKPVLVIDLDNCYGTISTYLGIRSPYGIADVLARKGLIDDHLIKSSAFAYMDGFHVLASPAGIESPRATSLQYENLPRALEACRQVYAYTILDAPRMPQALAADLAKLSDVVLIVFQLTVKDVNLARSMVSALTKAGISVEKIVPLANRVKKRGPLVRLEDSRKAVGLKSCQAIRNDWRKAMKSVNQGRPLAEVARSSSLRGDYRKLAARVRAYGINGGDQI